MKKLALVLGLALLAGVAYADDGKGDGGKGGKGGKGDKGKKPDPAAMFKKLDENGDGKISRSEFMKAPMVQKMDEKKAGSGDKIFSRLDKDKDDSLSMDEFKSFGEGKKPGKPDKGK